MAKSITTINSLLVNLKTINSALLIKLQKQGFDTSLTLGAEQEYTVKTLIHAIDNIAIQLLTITAKRSDFIQRTSFNERMEIETCLISLQSCISQTLEVLDQFTENANFQCDPQDALLYSCPAGQNQHLPLANAAHFVDLLKPYCRMLEMIIAHERIHALSAVLETLLSKEHSRVVDEDQELTEEQSNALQLSQYLIQQAL